MYRLPSPSVRHRSETDQPPGTVRGRPLRDLNQNVSSSRSLSVHELLGRVARRFHQLHPIDSFGYTELVLSFNAIERTLSRVKGESQRQLSDQFVHLLQRLEEEQPSALRQSKQLAQDLLTIKLEHRRLVTNLGDSFRTRASTSNSGAVKNAHPVHPSFLRLPTNANASSLALPVDAEIHLKNTFLFFRECVRQKFEELPNDFPERNESLLSVMQSMGNYMDMTILYNAERVALAQSEFEHSLDRLRDDPLVVKDREEILLFLYQVQSSLTRITEPAAPAREATWPRTPSIPVISLPQRSVGSSDDASASPSSTCLPAGMTAPSPASVSRVPDATGTQVNSAPTSRTTDIFRAPGLFHLFRQTEEAPIARVHIGLLMALAGPAKPFAFASEHRMIPSVKKTGIHGQDMLHYLTDQLPQQTRPFRLTIQNVGGPVFFQGRRYDQQRMATGDGIADDVHQLFRIVRRITEDTTNPLLQIDQMLFVTLCNTTFFDDILPSLRPLFPSPPLAAVAEETMASSMTDVSPKNLGTLGLQF